MIRQNKHAVREAFSGASGTYDGASPLQQEVGVSLVSFIREHCQDALRPQAQARHEIDANTARHQGLMLDAGCGTGRLSAALINEYPGASVIGCDFALPMLVEARRLGATERLVGADIDALPFSNGLFSLVASNLAYQWPPDTLASFREAVRVLKDGGLLTLSTLGPDTLFELRESCKAASMPIAEMGFLRPDEVSAALIKAGLDVISIESMDFTRQYTDIRSLVLALRNIGAMPKQPNANHTLIKGALLKKAGAVYCERFPGPTGGITATYDVIFVAARKI